MRNAKTSAVLAAAIFVLAALLDCSATSGSKKNSKEKAQPPISIKAEYPSSPKPDDLFTIKVTIRSQLDGKDLRCGLTNTNQNIDTHGFSEKEISKTVTALSDYTFTFDVTLKKNSPLRTGLSATMTDNKGNRVSVSIPLLFNHGSGEQQSDEEGDKSILELKPTKGN